MCYENATIVRMAPGDIFPEDTSAKSVIINCLTTSSSADSVGSRLVIGAGGIDCSADIAGEGHGNETACYSV